MTRLRRWYANRMIARLTEAWAECDHMHADGSPCLLAPVFLEQIAWWASWGHVDVEAVNA